MGEEVIRLTDDMLPYLKPGLIIIGEDMDWSITYGIVAITPEIFNTVSRYDRAWSLPIEDIVPVDIEGIEEDPNGLFLIMDESNGFTVMEGNRLLDPRMNITGLRIGKLRKGFDK